MEDACLRTDETLRGWERGDEQDAEDLSVAVAHIRQCTRCRSLYGSVVPLLRRDAGEPTRRGLGQAVPSAGFTDAVMEKAALERPPRAWGPSQRVLRLVLPLAAAVAVLAGAGAAAIRYLLPAQGAEVQVHFSLEAPGACRVSLAGDFNGWQPGVLNLMPARRSGTWEIAIPLRKGSMYTYDFLVDGQRWIPDPGSRTQVDDGFGGLSSVLRL
jgi:hypothetical protein